MSSIPLFAQDGIMESVGPWLAGLVVLVLIVLFSFLALVLKYYKRCPSNRVNAKMPAGIPTTTPAWIGTMARMLAKMPQPRDSTRRILDPPHISNKAMGTCTTRAAAAGNSIA